MYNSIFKDSTLAETIESKGWGLIDFCSNDEVSFLKEKFFELLPELDEMPVIITLLHNERKITKKINDLITQKLHSALEKHFIDYKIPIALYFAKKSKEYNDVGIHQDPMITDQAVSPSYGLWIPLVETTGQNGTLAVLEKSHKWFHPFQADTVSSSLSDIGNELIEKCITLNVKPGQAVIMDNRLVHYSHPNQSGEIRPCVVVKLTHKDAIYYTLYSKGGEIYLIKNNDDFYTSETWIVNKSAFPAGQIEGVLDFIPFAYSSNDLKEAESNNKTDIYQTKAITSWIKK